MSPLIDKAARIASEAHEGQRRVDGPPYISHPATVALMLAKHGFSDVVVAAALVHDVLEDTKYPAAQLEEELGEEVLKIVRAVSEDKNLSWKERKVAYLKSLREGPEGARAVSVADKIHNLTSLLAIHEREGVNTWVIFRQPYEEKLWFEEEMLKLLKEVLGGHPLVGEYEKLVEEMRCLKA